MLKVMMLSATLAAGQAAPQGVLPRYSESVPSGNPVTVIPNYGRPRIVNVIPVAREKLPAMPKADGKPAETAPASACPTIIYETCPSKSCGRSFELFKPWACEDLEMKEVEKDCGKQKCGGGLFRCPKDCEEAAAECNGHGDACAESKCGIAGLFGLGDCNGGPKVYGWIQGGFTGNVDSPRDRLNYGVQYGNRSNAVQLNQVYGVIEKAIDLDEKKDQFQIGYRLDFFTGHDAPYFEDTFGVFDDFTGDRGEFPRTSDIGISAPQFYADIHLPVLTDRGVDVRIGRFYTLVGIELFPAPQTWFYSHSYENFYGVAFTHLGAMATVHVGDTLDVHNCIIRGWDVAFDDNNDSWSYMGGLTWTSCDQKGAFILNGIFGPEQLQNNQNIRSLITANYSRTFGCKDQWKFITGGHVGWEQNATLDPTSPNRAAEWYGYSNYLFYTVDPRLILGIRGEWFHDDDGSRTIFTNSDNGGATWNRPGYAGSFYEITLGATYKPFKNLRLRPEVRFDWFDGRAIDGSNSLPYNDQTDSFQTTYGIDFVYEF